MVLRGPLCSRDGSSPQPVSLQRCQCWQTCYAKPAAQLRVAQKSRSWTIFILSPLKMAIYCPDSCRKWGNFLQKSLFSFSFDHHCPLWPWTHAGKLHPCPRPPPTGAALPFNCNFSLDWKEKQMTPFHSASAFLQPLEPAPSGLQTPRASGSCLPRCCKCAGEYKDISKLGDSCSR